MSSQPSRNPSRKIFPVLVDDDEQPSTEDGASLLLGDDLSSVRVDNDNNKGMDSDDFFQYDSLPVIQSQDRSEDFITTSSPNLEHLSDPNNNGRRRADESLNKSIGAPVEKSVTKSDIDVEIIRCLARGNGDCEDITETSSSPDDDELLPADSESPHWKSQDEFKAVEAKRAEINAAASSVAAANGDNDLVGNGGRLFASHCWRKTDGDHQERKRRLLAALSIPKAVSLAAPHACTCHAVACH